VSYLSSSRALTALLLAASLAMPAAASSSSGQRSRTAAHADAVRAANRAASIEPVPDAFVNAGALYPFSDNAVYRLFAAPERVSDIALERGEGLVAVASGDTVRWVIGDTTSGSGDGKRTHILVKPFSVGLATNVIVTTDRRTYHIALSSAERAAMVALSWTYPQDQLIALRRQNTEAQAAQPVATGIDISRVNFRYEIDGDRAPWRPLRAFDDGRQVFIEFPRGIGQGEMPPLFVVGPEGNTSELVNYRVRGNHMIVDRLFAAAELRFGAGDRQKRVRITRTDGRPAS